MARLRGFSGGAQTDGIDCPVFTLIKTIRTTLGTQLAAETTLWNRCVRDLQAELPEQEFNTWIRPLQAVEDGTILRLLAPNRFVVDWLKKHYLKRILELVGAQDAAAELVVEVGSRQPASAPATPSNQRPRPVALR